MSAELTSDDLKGKEGDVAMLVGMSKKIASFAENKRSKSLQMFGHLETLKTKLVGNYIIYKYVYSNL